MPKRRSLVAGLALSFGLALVAPASAYANTCSVAATSVAFGIVIGDQVASTGTITVTCNGGGTQPFALALSAGSGTFANRTMTQGAHTLSYNLYVDAAHTQIWGDGSSGTSTVTGTFDLHGSGPESLDEPAYGLVPAQTLPPPGSYLDTIIVTVTF